MNQSIKTIVFSTVFAVMPLTQVYAEDVSGLQELKKQDMKVISQEVRADVKAKISDKLNELKNKVAMRAVVRKGQVTAKGTSGLTVSEGGKTFTVNIVSTTKLMRRFYGKSTFDEIQVGHEVMVLGKFTDDAKTVIEARLVRDVSIQKRFGAFVGEVTALSGNTITLKTVNRGVQTVTTDANTKYVNRKEEKITLGDVKVGDRIRVKGMWDRSNNTITEVTHVKNYNLPLKQTVTPTGTPSASI